MKIHFSRRVLTALLLLGVLAAAFASTASAGNAYGRRSHAWFQVVRPAYDDRVAYRLDPYARPAFQAGVSFGDGRQFSRGAECAVVNHPPHRWYDGRLYCAGQNADGSWRNPAYRCEDDFGRKKVNLAGWDPRCEPAPPCN